MVYDLTISISHKSCEFPRPEAQNLRAGKSPCLTATKVGVLCMIRSPRVCTSCYKLKASGYATSLYVSRRPRLTDAGDAVRQKFPKDAESVPAVRREEGRCGLELDTVVPQRRLLIQFIFLDLLPCRGCCHSIDAILAPPPSLSQPPRLCRICATCSVEFATRFALGPGSVFAASAPVL